MLVQQCVCLPVCTPPASTDRHTQSYSIGAATLRHTQCQYSNVCASLQYSIQCQYIYSNPSPEHREHCRRHREAYTILQYRSCNPRHTQCQYSSVCVSLQYSTQCQYSNPLPEHMEHWREHRKECQPFTTGRYTQCQCSNVCASLQYSTQCQYSNPSPVHRKQHCREHREAHTVLHVIIGSIIGSTGSHTQCYMLSIGSTGKYTSFCQLGMEINQSPTVVECNIGSTGRHTQCYM